MHIKLPKPGGSPLLERFRLALVTKNPDSPTRQAMATDAACQVIGFLCALLEDATLQIPQTELWVPGRARYLPIRFEMQADFFRNAQWSLYFGGPFISAATAAAWLPAGFSFFDMVSVLDEAAWHERKGSLLASRYPFTRTLSSKGKANASLWLERTPSSDFPLVATLVAFDLSYLIYHAQRRGFEHLASITPISLQYGKTFEIGEARGSTATETVLRAAKRACDLMQSAGIDNGENIFLHQQQSAWKWLVENGLGKCLLPGKGEPEDLGEFSSLVEQERQKWTEQEAAAGRCPKCESPVPPVWVALNSPNAFPPPVAFQQLSAVRPGGDHIHYDQCTFTGGTSVAKQDIKFEGAVTAGNLIIAEKIEQSLIQNVNSTTPARLKDLLAKLAKALSDLAPSLDAKIHSQAAEDFDLLAKEAARSEPRMPLLKAAGEALIATITVAGVLAEPVVDIISAIFQLCGVSGA